MISVYQIYSNPSEEEKLEAAFLPYNGSYSDNDYFENAVIKEIYDMNPKLKEGVKYMGVTDANQYENSHFRAYELIDIIQKDIDAGIEKDVYIYDPVIYNTTLIHSIRYPNIVDLKKNAFIQIAKDTHLLNDSGVLPFDLFDGKWEECYHNYWIAKKEVFDQYCKTVLLPAISFFERPHIKEQMPKWHKINLRYYNSCVFIMDGLFGSFLAHNNYSFRHLKK